MGKETQASLTYFVGSPGKAAKNLGCCPCAGAKKETRRSLQALRDALSTSHREPEPDLHKVLLMAWQCPPAADEPEGRAVGACRDRTWRRHVHYALEDRLRSVHPLTMQDPDLPSYLLKYEESFSQASLAGMRY